MMQWRKSVCARKNRTPQRSCEVHVRTAVLLVDPEASYMRGIAKTAKDVSIFTENGWGCSIFTEGICAGLHRQA